MTKADRKLIIEQLDNCETCLDELRDIHSMLEEKYDNHSEDWKASEKGESEEEYLESLEDIISLLEEVYEKAFDFRGL